MKCLVTGGNGFIGSHVISELLCRGFEVISYDINFSNRLFNPRLSMVEGDIRDITKLSEASRCAKFVFHLSGLLGTSELFEHPKQAVDVNINGAINVLDDAARNTQRCFLPAKPNGANNIYSVTSQAVEKLGHSYRENMKVDVRILRLPNIYGPRQRVRPVRKVVPEFVTRALRDQPIEIFGDGNQLVELEYVTDTARSIVDLMLYDGDFHESLELKANKHMAVSALAQRVISLTDSNSELIFLPMRPGERARIANDPLRPLDEIVGPRKATSFEYGIKETIDWYRTSTVSTATDQPILTEDVE